jgi:hypothetical protein
MAVSFIGGGNRDYTIAFNVFLKRSPLDFQHIFLQVVCQNDHTS